MSAGCRTPLDFIDSLRPESAGGYKVQLEAVTQAKALYIYYQHLSRASGLPVEFLRDVMRP